MSFGTDPAGESPDPVDMRHMLAEMIRTPSGAFQTSSWALVAAIVLAGLGALLFYVAGLLEIQGFAHGADSGGVREFMIGGGALVFIIGVFHVAAALRIWAHRISGRNLGLGFGLVGTAFGLVVLQSALGQPPGNPGPELSSFFVIPYLVVLGGLLVGRSQFRRQSQERG